MADETQTTATTATTATASEASEATEADEAAPETDEVRQGLLDRLTETLGDAIVGSHIAPGHALWVRVTREAWVDAAEAAKNRLGCTFFDFLSGIDWMPSPWGRYEDAAGVDSAIPAIPESDPAVPTESGYAGGDTRFQVVCRVANVRDRGEHRAAQAVIIKADLPDGDLRIASLVPVYAGANWHERECWEMFGITFDGHPSLRHLYLPGGFEGHPLRKDFPLLARLVKPWPGIVDVEPMPEEPAASNGEGTSNGNGENAEKAENEEGGDDDS
jgi:NADH-quinone oxidoreductase subunit C